MIYNINGKLTVTDVNYIVVETGGVGFKCFTTLNTIKTIGTLGSSVNVYTYLCVKEDAMDLYAFSTTQELEAFKLLISVSGVGPKAAVSILSELSADKLALCIAGGDSKSITKAQGVGKKTAERIVLELKDKIVGIAADDDTVRVVGEITSSESSNSSEAIDALIALGYSRSDASVAVAGMDKSLSVDEMIRRGLRLLAKNL